MPIRSCSSGFSDVASLMETKFAVSNISFNPDAEVRLQRLYSLHGELGREGDEDRGEENLKGADEEEIINGHSHPNSGSLSLSEEKCMPSWAAPVAYWLQALLRAVYHIKGLY